MRVIAPFFSALASIATIISVIIRLKWHKEVVKEDNTPTRGQIWRKRIATVWLVLIALTITILVIMVVVSALGDLLF